MTPEELADVRRLVETSGGLACAKAAVGRYAEQAQRLLDRLSPSAYVSALRLLVRTFTL
jgi:geranylgeranyl pyrophosphate synthase